MQDWREFNSATHRGGVRSDFEANRRVRYGVFRTAFIGRYSSRLLGPPSPRVSLVPASALPAGVPGVFCTNESERSWYGDGPGFSVPARGLVLGLFLLQSNRG